MSDTKRCKCRFCKYETIRWSLLKEHVMTEHEAEFLSVESWLDEVSMDKLIQVRELAAKGMK